MGEIKIGIEEFKALSSDTRVNIIKMLNERNHTLSELAKKMNMSSPTIKQHLETLIKSNLIEQKDEGRKWKYYTLTRKGKKLMEPEEKNVMVLLAATLIGLIFLIYVFFGSGLMYADHQTQMREEFKSIESQPTEYKATETTQEKKSQELLKGLSQKIEKQEKEIKKLEAMVEIQQAEIEKIKKDLNNYDNQR
jgi:DNA-binding transcriptional ArsR family regulator